MKPQKFVRPFRENERTMLESGCRALDAFTVRRCQMLLASAEGLAPSTIASQQRCARQTVHHVLDAFAERGLDCLRHGSHVPRSVAPVLTAEKREPLQALLH
jgi:Winged helix-turn helix